MQVYGCAKAPSYNKSSLQTLFPVSRSLNSACADDRNLVMASRLSFIHKGVRGTWAAPGANARGGTTEPPVPLHV